MVNILLVNAVDHIFFSPYSCYLGFALDGAEMVYV